jgi:uridine kinase
MTAPFFFQADKKDVNLNTSLELKEEGNLVSIPVNKYYTNLLDKSTVSSIKKDLKLVSGIYAFVHNDTKKIYIGSSFSLAKRINDHLNN